MRKKFIDKVYMKEVIEKKWYLEEDLKDNCFIALKYIVETSRTEDLSKLGLDKGCALLEYLPREKYYNCRVFFNKNNEPFLFYFDINNGNGVDNGIPWYDDLYLDVICSPAKDGSGKYAIVLDDEDELQQALDLNMINKEEYSRAYTTAINLIKEIENGTNTIINRCIPDMVRIKKINNID